MTVHFLYFTFALFHLNARTFVWAHINCLSLTYRTGRCDNLLSLQSIQVHGEALDVVSCEPSNAVQTLGCLTALRSVVSCFMYSSFLILSVVSCFMYYSFLILSVVSCFMYSSFLILYFKRLRCSAFKGMVAMRRAAAR